MGCSGESKKKRNQKDSEKNKYQCRFTEEQIRTKLMNFYENAKIIKDDSTNNNKDFDMTFVQIKKYEETKLEEYFLSKKDEFTETLSNEIFFNQLPEIPNNILERLIEKEN